MESSELPEGLVVSLIVPSGKPIPDARIRSALGRLFRRVGARDGELSVAFLSDAPIRRMNHDHLGHDWVPDVLSFDLGGADERLVADIYVGLEQAVRQAREHGVPTDEEMVRLVLHGTLHVLGFDHPEDSGAREESELWRIQEAVLCGASDEEAS